MAQKTKQLPNDQQIVLNPVSEMRFIVKLKYESSTILLFVSIRYSMRDLNNYAWQILIASDSRWCQPFL